MFNKNLEKKILDNKTKNKWIYPRYKDYCLSNIPSLILKNFGLGKKSPLDKLSFSKTSKMILILLDSFGYLSFKKYYKKFKLLNYLAKNSLVSPLTTVFPSTTAAALTSLSTGIPPSQHGLFEWHLFLPEVDEVIETLTFKKEGSPVTDSLAKKFNPKILFSNKPITKTLSQNGVKTIRIINKEYVNMSYSKLDFKDSKPIPLENLSQLPAILEKIKKTSSPLYVFLYLDIIDSISHLYGPDSRECQATMLEVFSYLWQGLLENSTDKKDITVIFCADHGQVTIDPTQTIYLSDFPKLRQYVKLNKNNQPILATGSCRDVFLHIKKEKIEITVDYLKRRLKDKADVVLTKELITNNLFGHSPTKKFLSRVGDIAILPKGYNTVWWRDDVYRPVNLLGHHGGLTSQEMLIPFLSLQI